MLGDSRERKRDGGKTILGRTELGLGGGRANQGIEISGGDDGATGSNPAEARVILCFGWKYRGCRELWTMCLMNSDGGLGFFNLRV